MTGIIMKLIIYPIGLIVSNYIFKLQYTYAQAITIGLILAIVAHVMELLVLKRGTLWISTMSDLVISFMIIYLSQSLFNNTSIYISNALFTALLLTVTEYFQHTYLIGTGKAWKKEK